MRIAFNLLLCAALSSTVLAAQSPPQSTAGASAREFYVGCSLLARGDELENPLDFKRSPLAHSAAMCSLEIGFQLAFFTSKPEGFCPPTQPSFRVDPARAMAGAYLNWFEEYAPKAASLSGRPAMLLSFKQAWPCK